MAFLASASMTALELLEVQNWRPLATRPLITPRLADRAILEVVVVGLDGNEVENL